MALCGSPPYVPAVVTFLPLATPPPPATTTLQRTLLERRQAVLDEAQSIPALSAYAAVLTAATAARTNVPPTAFTIGDAAARVDGQGAGFELFMTLHALVHAYAQRAVAASSRPSSSAWPDAVVDWLRAEDLALGAVGVHARHAGVGPHWPPLLRDAETMGAALQRERATHLGLQAQHVAGAYLLATEPAAAQSRAVVRYVIEAYRRRGDQRTSDAWSARLAAALARDPTAPAPDRLWRACALAAQRAGDEAMVATAKQAQQSAAAERLHGGGGASAIEAEDEHESLAFEGIVAAPFAMSPTDRPTPMADIVAQGDLWRLQAGAVGTDAPAAPPGGTDPPAPARTTAMSLLLGLPSGHALLRLPTYSPAQVERMLMVAVALEKHRRLCNGNEPSEAAMATLQQILDLAAKEDYWLL
jgi:hypothetical protein